MVIYTIFSVQILLRIIFYARLVVVALRILIHREKIGLMKWLTPAWIWKIWHYLLELLLIFPVLGITTIFLAGVAAWGAFNWSLELTNTEKFCISCHEMKSHILPEYKKSTHYANRTGIRASCPDCHVPREWIHKVKRKVFASNELYHWAMGSIRTTEDFKAKRLKLAEEVWLTMKATNSRECRNCHRNDFMENSTQSIKAELMHALAVTWEMTCIDCHQGIAHTLPKEFDKEVVMDNLHDRMEKEKVNCRSCHEKIAGPPPGEGWD